ncbi:MAG: helix-turn-helix domain-containing protein [Pseudomonadota bacterium]
MEALMDRSVVEEITTHFKALCSIVPLRTIRNEKQYDDAVYVLNQLLDAGAADEKHALAELANTLGSLIAAFEDSQPQPLPAAPVDVLRLLMDQHHLSQSDLPEIGTQGVVSEVLNGKRELNVRQVKALSERFNVPTSVFL